MHWQPPEWHDSLPSTNTALLERLRAGEALPSGWVLAAREQTAGRGRLGRTWTSRPGRDLTFSVLVRSDAEPVRLLSLPMAAALGVADALDQWGIRARVKWPNDVLAGPAGGAAPRKICGIHTERAGDGMVVGIGLNVNMEAAEAAVIDRPATSMRAESGRWFVVDQVLAGVLAATSPWVDRWSEGGFAALREAWCARCVGQGEAITVMDGDRRAGGVLAGFGTHGQLLLDDGSGGRREIWAGDVAV